MNPRLVQNFPAGERVGSPGIPKVSSVSLKVKAEVTSDSGESESVSGGIV